MSKILIIDKKQVTELKEYAETHIITLEECLKILKGKLPIVGNREKYHVKFFDGFKFVFTIEESTSKDLKEKYLIKRLSGSAGDTYPNLQAMQEMMNYLDMGKLEECIVNVRKNEPQPNIEIIRIIEKFPLDSALGNKMSNAFKKYNNLVAK